MLNSNQVRTKLFVRADLDKLTKQRLKLLNNLVKLDNLVL